MQRVFPNLDFAEATNAVQADDGMDRLFVTEQSGRVLAFPNRQDAAEATVFLDIRPLVSTRHNEEGLLGLAFHPRFRDNGLFFVYYSATDPRRNVLARYIVSADGTQADRGSAQVLIEIPKPFGNHNGGQLAFGTDGYLYISVGDGGGGNRASGQATSDLLGSILRIDMDGGSAQRPYSIPPDNPFVGIPGARDELWAIGLRNPWRFSFDAETGRLWAADVGERDREEIDLIERGGNYGWPILEGTLCLDSAERCARPDLVPPVWEYGHNEGCSVTGGFVSRDPQLPSLEGAYIFADFCSGRIWALRYSGPLEVNHVRLVDSQLNITSFGVTLDGTLLAVTRQQGLYRLAPA